MMDLPHRLRYPNTWLPQLVVLFGEVMGLLGYGALLEDTGHWGRLWELKPHFQFVLSVPCLWLEVGHLSFLLLPPVAIPSFPSWPRSRKKP